MSLFSSQFSPVHYLRHRALYDGVLGGSTLWKIVAVMVVLRKVFGKQPEHLGIERLAPGQSIQIIAIKPSSRRARRRRSSGDPS